MAESSVGTRGPPDRVAPVRRARSRPPMCYHEAVSDTTHARTPSPERTVWTVPAAARRRRAVQPSRRTPMPGRATSRPPALDRIARPKPGRPGRRRRPDGSRPRSRAGSPLRSRSLVGAAAIVVSAAFSSVTTGLFVVAGSTACSSPTPSRSARRHLRPGGGSCRPRPDGRLGRPGAGRHLAIRMIRGRRAAARRLPRRGLRARSSRPVRARRDRRRVAGGAMTEPGEFRLRRPVEADHARLVGQVDEWWGGRKVHAAPAATVVPALHGHVLGRRGRAGSAGRLRRRVRQPGPSRTRRTST